jgi:hypothetical protein
MNKKQITPEKIKSSFKKIGTEFLKLDKENFISPNTFVVANCDWDNWFIPWLFSECEIENIEIKSGPCAIAEAFDALKKKRNVNEDIMWFDSSKLLFLNEKEAVVGIFLCDGGEQNSLKRIQINVREELEKLKFLDNMDDPEMVQIYNDVLIYEN